MQISDYGIEDLSHLTDADKLIVVGLLKKKAEHDAQRTFFNLYPERDKIVGGIRFHSRDKYPKHMEFFEAGATYAERCAMAANRVGKSFGMGGYETAAHLTGLYPDWWIGKRFDRPVVCWAVGKNNKTTRDIIQKILFGSVIGSGPNKRLNGHGLVYGPTLGRTTWDRGTADLIDNMRVGHITGGDSLVTLKSYERGRSSFEGDSVDIIWLDEECPLEIYEEALYRTMTTGGILYLTFTPLAGLSPTVLQFLPEMNPDA